MKKIAFIAGIWVLASSSLAFTTQEYLNDNASQALRGFQVLPTQAEVGARGMVERLPANGLRVKRARSFSVSTQQYNTSYYQYYHGIRVLDGEVSIHEPNQLNSTSRSALLNKAIGQLVQDIEIDPKDLSILNSPENLAAALADAKIAFLRRQVGFKWDIQDNHVDLVIKNQSGKLLPLYEIRFYVTAPNHTPIFYHAFLDPTQKNKIINEWNDIMSYSDFGPGGNTKTQEYHYGQNGIPGLDVNKRRGKCELFDRSTNLIVVDMSKKDPSSPDYNDYMVPYRYTCQSEVRDLGLDFGAYSPADDAYFFGHLVQEAYQDWYQTKVLDQPIIALRVHYRESPLESMQNAFWDDRNKTMNFGDGGERYYPMISPEITGHEIGHGFTSAHSHLQMHDESGSLNEAFSDMAGVMVTAYMEENYPSLYQVIYHNPDMKWSTGSTIMKNSDPNIANRYYDTPSRDGESADCYHLIRGVDQCKITYNSVISRAIDIAAHNVVLDGFIQDYIVHKASGVYNRFFYLLANSPGWDIKKAFNLMLVSNRDGYWGENSGFQLAACQTLVAAFDLGYETTAIRNAFTNVGIDTRHCR